MNAPSSHPDWILLAVLVAVAAMCAYCIFWMVKNGKPMPRGKAGTRWEHHQGLMKIEIALTAVLMTGAIAAAFYVWFR